MNIVFEHLKLHNFLSFGDAEIDLNNKGYTLISGENHNPDDMAKSNGSGKSAIWDSICWVLTGETIRGVKNTVVNIHTTGGCFVELTFNIDGNSYKICRYRNHKDFGSNLKIVINGEDKSGKGIRDSEKLLAEYLPDLTSSLLGSVIILGQGLPQRFSNNTPSGRKDVLEKLSKSDFMIEDLKTKLSSRKQVLSSQLRTQEDALLMDTSQLSTCQKQFEEIKNKIDNLSAADQYQQQIDASTQAISDLNGKIDKIRSEYANTQAELDRRRQYISELGISCTNAIAAINGKYDALLADDVSRRSDLRAELSSLEREISKIENIKDVCPTCGQKLPDVHKPDTTASKNLWNSLKAELDAVNERIQKIKYEQVAATAQEQSQYENRTAEFTKAYQELKCKSDNQYAVIGKYENELRTQLTIQSTAKVNLEQLSCRRVELQQSLEALSIKIDNLQKKIGYNNLEKDETKSRLEAVNKMITIATRDFRGYLLSNVITFINCKAKEYAQDIFETDKIDFILDGNNIDILYDGKPYENLSGGERQKVDIIIQFAIRDMLCQFSNFTSNILVLDEVFDGLDAIGCQKVVDLIAKRLVDIDSVFIITHHADILLPVDATITVIKDSTGISKIK